MIELVFALFLLSAETDNKTFVLPEATTNPEEKQVATAYPVLPVTIETLNSL